MRKKFTLLFASLFLCVGAWAQLSVGSVYSIQNKQNGNAISQNANFELATVDANTEDNAQLWIVEEGVAEGTVMFRNLASGRYAQSVAAYYTHWFTDFVAKDFYVGEIVAATDEAPAYYYISYEAISDITKGQQSVMHQSNGYVVRWEQTADHSHWKFVEVEVEPSKLVDITETWKEMSADKAAAVNELENLARLSIYSDAQASISGVNAVTATGTTIAELRAASESINSVLANCKKQIDGKFVTFTNCSEDGRGGRCLGYDKANSRAAAVASTGDDVIWTIKVQENGLFKLYNFVHNVYLGVPADPTPVVAAEADAPAFDFIVTGENQVALVTGGQMVHVANHTNYKLIHYYSTSDKASLWAIAETDDIVVTREQYDLASAAKEALPYAIQQAYGLVTDAAKYTSNAPETQVAENSSYTNLLDNNYESYFHSSWSYAVGDYHYLQAEVSEEVESFYFYFKKRKQNENNRPTEIEILGSTDGENYTIPVATISEGLPTTAGTIDYFSAKITATESVKYLRFVVKGTNNGASHEEDEGHPFFTFSEFYILPAVDDVTNLIDSYKAFASSSITSETMATAATALINAEGTLALSNIKKEVAALLSANASNHAATPVLGQYSTEGYNALNAAYAAADATLESLEAAIAEFNASKNLPVFTINGVIDYAAGKSIYDEPGKVNGKGNTHYFKTTDKSDKTMWWALDMTTTEIGVIESVGIRNVGTGANFWGCPTIKITETEENEGAGIADDGIFLFYTTNDNNPIHAQNDGQLICRYSDKGAASGSAWTFTYIGNSYDLNKESGESTDIEAPAVVEAATVIYDLLGRRVEKMEKGLYIVNGRKVLVK